MSDGDIDNISLSAEDLVNMVEKFAEWCEIVKEALKEAAAELSAFYDKMAEVFRKCGFEDFPFVDYSADKPRERFPVVNEKKRRRIKNKDRFFRWFAMTAHNNTR